ncbi:unnamed protein product, partial [marine sediment metagenome]
PVAKVLFNSAGVEDVFNFAGSKILNQRPRIIKKNPWK